MQTAAGASLAGSLISTLIDNLCGPLEEVRKQRLHHLAARMLASRLQPSIKVDEAQLKHTAHKHLSAGLHGREQCRVFDELSARVCASAVRHHLHVVYLLLSLAGETRAPGLPALPSIHNTGVARKAPARGSERQREQGKKGQRRRNPDDSLSEWSGSEEEEKEIKTPVSQPSKAGALARVVKQRTFRSVSEAGLVRDLLFVFQGIDGQFVQWDDLHDAFRVPAPISLSPALADLLAQLCEVGALFRRVRAYTESGVGEEGGLASQSLRGVLQEHVAEHLREIAELETEVLKPQDTAHWSLKRMLVWAQEPLRRLSVLVGICEATKGLRGGPLVSEALMHLDHGDPLVRSVVSGVCKAIIRPLLHMVKEWVSRGQIVDPYREFFVRAEAGGAGEWARGFTLKRDLVPSFLDMHTAEKIFNIGKSINFIRDNCDEAKWVLDLAELHTQPLSPVTLLSSSSSSSVSLSSRNLPFSWSNVLSPSVSLDSGLASLRALVGRLSSATDAKLVSLVRDKHRFEAHCRLLKRYLLLGQGDFIQHLLQALWEELNKDATQVHKHALKGLLDQAVRVSHVSDEDEVLERLDIRLLPATRGDTGWEIFTLDVHAGSPLNAVFTEEAMRVYLRLFNFLWRLKRVERTLGIAWARQAAETKLLRVLTRLHPCLRQSQLLCAEMTHLVKNLHSYMMFEVLECAWKDLVSEVKQAGSLDALILAHRRYLTQITEMALLGGSTETLISCLEQIFKLVLHFAVLQEELIKAGLAEVSKREQVRQEAKLSTQKGGWGISAEDTALQSTRALSDAREADIAATFSSKLDVTAASYRRQLLGFLTLLDEKLPASTSAAVHPPSVPAHVRQNFAFLLFRLDFNEFYTKEKKKRLDRDAALDGMMKGK